MRCALLAAAFVCSVAAAQPYPAHPVKLIVPYPPGSTPDIVGRTLGAMLQDAFGQQAKRIEISDVRQTAWATNAGTFKLSGLDMKIGLGRKECF